MNTLTNRHPPLVAVVTFRHLSVMKLRVFASAQSVYLQSVTAVILKGNPLWRLWSDLILTLSVCLCCPGLCLPLSAVLGSAERLSAAQHQEENRLSRHETTRTEYYLHQVVINEVIPFLTCFNNLKHSHASSVYVSWFTFYCVCLTKVCF